MVGGFARVTGRMLTVWLSRISNRHGAPAVTALSASRSVRVPTTALLRPGQDEAPPRVTRAWTPMSISASDWGLAGMLKLKRAGVAPGDAQPVPARARLDAKARTKTGPARRGPAIAP